MVKRGRGALMGLFAAVLTLAVSGAVHGAKADTTGECDNKSALAAGQLVVTQQKGRVLIDITRKQSAGRKLDVEYGDEVFSQKFGPEGRVRVAFALTAADNQFTISGSEMLPITCSIKVPEFGKIYRAILRWHDPVQLNLYVLEPGGRPGEAGEVDGTRPNNNLKGGIGQMDIVGTVPLEESTGEMSYVVDTAAIPAGGVFGFKLDYMTRGSQPEAPYCDDNPLAAPQFDFLVIENGNVRSTKMGLNRAHCHDKIPENRRLMPIRQ